ncbi:MAG: hypothetical protein IPK58_00180 [Acidobacteria bacterium]|nr:hypothetical protein [Acidobacteriota bacterium]
MESEFRQTDEEERLGQLLRSLDRVETPTDFGTRVKARIASEKPDGSRRGFRWFVTLGAPAAGLILFAALIWMSGDIIPGDQPVSVIEPDPFVRAIGVESAPVERAAVSEPPILGNRRFGSKDAMPPDAAKRKRVRFRMGEDPLISRSVRAKRKRRRRPWNTSPEKNKMPRSSIPIEGVLIDLGIGANVENGKWIVKAVRANSLADRSRIAVGDVIEAIDDRTVGAATVFERSAQGKTITVTRNGVRVVVQLK